MLSSIQDSVIPMVLGLSCTINDWSSLNLFKMLLAFVIRQGKELWGIVVCLLQLGETAQTEDLMSPSAQSDRFLSDTTSRLGSFQLPCS